MKRLGKSALLFIAIGLVLYALVYYAAEQLLYRTGKSNPFFKIATVERSEFDWVVLGASHAMPFDFDDFNAFMERETGLHILNLASPGTGPLYNRFAFEHFVIRTRRRTCSMSSIPSPSIRRHGTRIALRTRSSCAARRSSRPSHGACSNIASGRASTRAPRSTI
jgi:hypothetical protein